MSAAKQIIVTPVEVGYSAAIHEEGRLNPLMGLGKTPWDACVDLLREHGKEIGIEIEIRQPLEPKKRKAAAV